MRFDTLTQIEDRFRKEAASALKPFSLPISGENLMLNGQLFKPNRRNYYYETEHKKERIVLHFTAGNVRSDMITLTTQDRHISVPFVIGRDGTIYQLFPSKFWSGHLGAGVGNAGTGNAQDKATIGIELSNYGFLVPKDGNLETIYSRVKDKDTGQVSPVDVYCTLDNKAAYTKTDSPFREQSFYPTYTAEQLDSLIILLRYLTTKYNIPRQFLPPDKRYTTIQDVLNFKGIVSHVNYRSSGKWDLGPAFDWAMVTEGVQASAYISADTKEINARGLEEVLTSEEEIESQFPINRDVLQPDVEVTDNEGYNPNDYDDKDIINPNPITSIKKIYALLVGINNYERVRKLQGCVNDVNAVSKYLKNNTDFDLKVEELIDAAANRDGVIKGFRTFLSQATKDDTVLFYFSGHGTQEKADPIWDETDEALECIVCHDGGTTKTSQFLLTDKELRYLIHQLSQKTKAHIVTIFDCCHSGDNTRNAGVTEANYPDRNVRRVTDKAGKAFPMRNWDEFLFSESIHKPSDAGEKPAAFLPQGTHVQMAACESDQVALEVAREGVFTKTLLKMLTDSGGNISYNTLRSRIRQYMRAGFEQTPRVYLPFDAELLLNTGFLNRTIDPQKMICEATHNTKQGWQLNVGAIHGMKSSTKITLFDPQDPKKTFTTTVRKGGVFVDYTLLDAIGLNDDTTYKAEVAGLLMQELVLKLENHDGTLKEMKELADKLLEKTSGGFSFGGGDGVKNIKKENDSGNSKPADYSLHVHSGEMYLTWPDDPYRPLTRPILYVKDDGTKDISGTVATLHHVSRWHFIKGLQNEDKPEGFPDQPLTIELTHVKADGTSVPIDVTNDTAELDYEKAGNEWKGTIQIKVTNTTDQDLYFCAAYLSKEFQCFLDFIPERVKLLQSGKSIFLGATDKKGVTKDRINLKMGDVEREYNWPQTLEALKFIISTEEFVAEALTLEELPKPWTSADKDKKKSLDTGTRGFDTEEEPVEFSGWGTQTLTLVFKNPVHNQIPASTLKALLDWDETAYYAAGLYYDVESDKETGQPTFLKLKDGIKMVVPEDEKGLFSDLKLLLSNKVETAIRQRRYNILKHDTSRLRIVAEGDSWFQYPILLQDTIDQLYKAYAIRSFAEAGDTLANYLIKKEYLDPIGLEDAHFFLVSGGGNDVLGDEFKFFLRETPDTSDTTPKRYLNAKFFETMTTLSSQYHEMFTELLNKYPDLHIMVHCYDYIIPVDTDSTPKKQSWSGKHMIAKGIEPQVERETLIHFILDEFASRLTALVNKPKFKDKVSFVDTRGLVNRTGWFDEIHPTSAGFQLVGDKFMKEIERVRSKKSI
ncbi:caspase family protein [Dyadobacter sp. 32]|uniref:caspase family protein n=1 Tax=Dyadobacter sp. 32 TaxID=538966 RepID=UPI0011EFEB2F